MARVAAAAAVIGVAGFAGFPVSTTYVVTGGISGAHASNGYHVADRHRVVLTLPVTIVFSSGLFYVLS
jgi:PiT family inorganic phosphate transporter